MTRMAVDERRRQLTDAAFRVIARDGITAASTRTICAEAGMPQASFHYCFDSKRDLLEELVQPHGAGPRGAHPARRDGKQRPAR